MLLNEMQHQVDELHGMQHEIAMLKESNLAMQAALTKLASKDERLASR
jgi:hypothetical protein